MPEIQCEVLVFQTQRYRRRHMAEGFQGHAIECCIDEIVHIIRRADLAQPWELALHLHGWQPAAHRQVKVSPVWLKQTRIVQGHLPSVGTARFEYQSQHT
ncbi:hypothetical protein D3C78_1429490 [compost metagenome]